MKKKENNALWLSVCSIPAVPTTSQIHSNTSVSKGVCQILGDFHQNGNLFLLVNVDRLMLSIHLILLQKKSVCHSMGLRLLISGKALKPNVLILFLETESQKRKLYRPIIVWSEWLLQMLMHS